jgi:hypothetical protein
MTVEEGYTRPVSKKSLPLGWLRNEIRKRNDAMDCANGASQAITEARKKVAAQAGPRQLLRYK